MVSAIWLKLPELPIEYYDEKSLFQIAKRLGRPRKTNITIISSIRGKYARICVAMDLSKPLIPAFTLEKKQYRVEYEFLHSPCFKCGKVGHRVELCREVANRTGISD